MDRKRVFGPMVGRDEVRVCPVCGAEIDGMGVVGCGNHFKGYSFPSNRDLPLVRLK